MMLNCYLKNLKLVVKSIVVNPDHPLSSQDFYDQAVVYRQMGNRKAALESCQKALEINPDFASAHVFISQIILPGENYLQVIQRIQQRLQPATYVEVGVFKGNSFLLAGKNTLAIGIDPGPVYNFPLPPLSRIFTQTSDEFFSRHDLKVEMRNQSVDLAFIDGMHLFEYALRDFIHLEKHSHAHSTFLIHDCHPLDFPTSSRKQVTGFWSGDTWKMIPCLKKYRPDLQIHTIATWPTGLGIVRKLDSESCFLKENYEQICEEFVPLDYRFLDDEKAVKLNLMPNDWRQIEAFITKEYLK